MHPTRAAAHFPLVPRPRPAARPPADRIGELAATARELRDGAEAMEAVARVFNRTALLYSDLGMAEEARRLCWEHADIYTGAYPLDGCTARMSLEPVVNLARLAIRAGEGARGHRILHALHEGAAQARPVRVEDRTLHLERITAAPADRAELVRWLWMVLLGDGLRALAADGRWEQAAQEAHRRSGVGDRLLDGRQAAVIARAASGDAAGALEIIEESRPEQEWEEAVASCLQVLCRTAGRLPDQGAVGEMVRRCMKVLQGPAPVVFSVRLGLAAAELAENSGGTVPDALVSHLAAKAAEDGHAARDVLASCRSALPEEQAEVLRGMVAAAGLGSVSLEGEGAERLLRALGEARNALFKALDTARGSRNNRSPCRAVSP